MIDDFVTTKALLDKIVAFATLHNWDLSKQDVPFTPNPSKNYLKETFLANKTDPLGLAGNSSDEQLPIYQVDIFTQKDKGGRAPGLVMANLLKAEFPRALYLVDTAEQKVVIKSVSSRIMPANSTHNWNMIEIDLTVLACN